MQLAIALLLLILVGCTSHGSWTQGDEKRFLASCNGSQSQCECAMHYLERAGVKIDDTGPKMLHEAGQAATKCQ